MTFTDSFISSKLFILRTYGYLMIGFFFMGGLLGLYLGLNRNDLLIEMVIISFSIASMTSMFYGQSLFGGEYRFWCYRFFTSNSIIDMLKDYLKFQFFLTLLLQVILGILFFTVKRTVELDIMAVILITCLTNIIAILWVSIIGSVINPMPFEQFFLRINYYGSSSLQVIVGFLFTIPLLIASIILYLSIKQFFGNGEIWLYILIFIILISLIFLWKYGLTYLSKTLYKNRFKHAKKLSITEY
jgi:hypothetical protein